LSISIRATFALLFVIVQLLDSKAAAARRWPPVSADILIDAATGRVLRATRADARTQPASLTKMMTLMLTFEELEAGRLKLSDRLVASRHAVSMQPSRLGLGVGEAITVEEAIVALTTKSANDAAVVLAEAIAGSERAFAGRMTRRARSLGMNRTTFRNASGLPDGRQLTTARDIGRLSRALIDRHPRYYAYFSRRSFVWHGRRIWGHNRLLARYPGADGIKTGFVSASGFNIAVSAQRAGRRYIAVVLGGASAESRDRRVARLLDLGFSSRPEKTRVARVAPPPARPTAAVRSAGADAGPADGSWVVQIGAFGDAAAARRQLARAGTALEGAGIGGNPELVPAGGLTRARFRGLAGDAAEAACATLRAGGQSCWAYKEARRPEAP
jgi:D-alanyl-D-alanine carboxypeptidase